MTEQVNIPKVRFSGFESNWSQYALKDVATLTSGMHLSPEDYSASGTTPYFTGPSDITSNISEVKKFTEKSKQVAKFGEILITVKGSGVGKTAFCMLPSAFMGRQLMSINASSALNPIIQALLEQRINKLESLAMGNMIPGLSRVDILSLKMSLPDSEEEQQKIASFLSKIDEKVALLTEKKDKLTEYKKGVMQQLFNGKWEEQDEQLTFIPPTLRFKADDGSEFPDWGIERIGDYIKTVSLESSSSYPLYSLTIADGIIPKPDRYIRDFLVQDELEAYKAMDFNHFAFNPMNVRFGAVAMLKDNLRVNVSRYYDVFEINALGNSKFFDLFLTSYVMLREYNRIATGSLIEKKRVHFSEFKEMLICLPSLEEQTKIASFLSAIDQKIDLANSELEKAKEWKKGLLQQMFV